MFLSAGRDDDATGIDQVQGLFPNWKEDSLMMDPSVLSLVNPKVVNGVQLGHCCVGNIVMTSDSVQWFKVFFPHICFAPVHALHSRLKTALLDSSESDTMLGLVHGGLGLTWTLSWRKGLTEELTIWCSVVQCGPFCLCHLV